MCGKRLNAWNTMPVSARCRATSLGLSSCSDQALAVHRAIFEAIRDGHAERAAAIAHSHVLDARDEALRAIGSMLA